MVNFETYPESMTADCGTDSMVVAQADNEQRQEGRSVSMHHGRRLDPENSSTDYLLRFPWSNDEAPFWRL